MKIANNELEAICQREATMKLALKACVYALPVMLGVQPAFAGLLTVGPNVNITKLTGNQAESTISVNPTNTMNLFESDTISNVGHYSVNGGLTWSTSNLSALPSSIGNVQTGWDSFGNLFLTRFGPSLSIVVARSADGGATFTDVRTVSAANSNDQPSIAVGAHSVWVSFTNAANQIVATGASVTGLGVVGAFGALQVAPGGGGDFGDIAIGPTGKVATVYQNNGSGPGPDTIKFNLDADGLGAGGFGAQSIVTATNVGGFRSITPQPNRSIDAEANLAWDTSGGAHNGRLYMVYVNAPSTTSNDTDIFVRYSDDNGTTWSAPVRVNDDATTNSQFNPAIAVDETIGNVAVTWYDARNSPGDNTTQIFGTVSDNGGLSFLPNVQISTGTSNGSLVDSPFDYGDYDKMTFDNGMFWRSWADNSNSTGDNPNGTGALDIYTAKVTFTAVPEPSTWLLLATGGAVLFTTGWRRRKRNAGIQFSFLSRALPYRPRASV